MNAHRTGTRLVGPNDLLLIPMTRWRVSWGRRGSCQLAGAQSVLSCPKEMAAIVDHLRKGMLLGRVMPGRVITDNSVRMKIKFQLGDGWQAIEIKKRQPARRQSDTAGLRAA